MFELSKRDSDIIKGIAIILMFVHHFFCFPMWYIDNISYPQLIAFAELYRYPTKICVSLFAFLSGYAYGVNREKRGNTKHYFYGIKKITDLYIGYWCVFIPLFVIAVKTTKESLTVENFFAQMIGINSRTMLFAWYVPVFAMMMILLPIVVKWGNSNRVLYVTLAFILMKFFSTIIVWNVTINWIKSLINDFQGIFPIFALGYYYYKWRVFDKLQMGIKPDKRIISVFILIVVMIVSFYGREYSRSFKVGEMYFKGETIEMIYSMDILYAPLIIWAIANLAHIFNYENLVLKLLEELGKKSMMMWFVSCAFFSNLSQFFQPLLYWPYYPILVVLWGCLFCYGFACFLNCFSNKLCIYKNKLLDSINN